MTRANFSPLVKKQARERANYTCEKAGCEASAIEVDHIKPCWRGGKANLANAQVLCAAHHKEKTAEEAKDRAKADRQSGRKGQYARRKKKGPQMKSRGFQNSKYKRTVDGKTVLRA